MILMGSSLLKNYMTSTPLDLGFSEEYDSYRAFQAQTIEKIINSDKHLIVVSAPTGSGKSILALGVARIAARSGLQTRILTNNKYLQTQYMSYRFDSEIPVQGIGKSNFLCIRNDVEPGTTAAEAPCNHGMKCELRSPLYEGRPETIECPFYRQRDMADAARISILNYPFYFYETKYGLFPTDILICDEGHQIDSQILSVASSSLQSTHLSELSRLGVKVPYPRELLLGNNPGLTKAIQSGLLAVTSYLRQYDEGDVPPPLYVDLQRRLQSIAELNGRLAVAQEFTYSPILSEQFSKDYLKAKKIVLMSATIFGPEYWSHRLGIDDVEYLEVPSSFPAHKRPIYIQSVCKVNQKWWDNPTDQKKLINAIDNIIKKHIPKKGLIHSVSYRLTEWILANSMFAGSGYLIKGDSDQVVEDWKQADKGILVSPRATEGVDLPNELCDFIIIPKVPYLSLGDQVTRLQMQEIPGFYEYKAMSSIIQGAGRGMRHKDDFCETYILDSLWYALYGKMKDQLPKWFTEALIWLKKNN